MHIDPAILTPLSLFLGALIGGGASVCAAVYTQRSQDRLQRIAGEVAKREAVYADFVMSASNLLLDAFIHDEISPSSDEQRLIGLIHRMRLFAPAECGPRSRGGAQSHSRDRAQAEYRTPGTRETGVVQEPGTRSASGVQRDLPDGFRVCAKDGRVMDAAHHLVLLAGPGAADPNRLPNRQRGPRGKPFEGGSRRSAACSKSRVACGGAACHPAKSLVSYQGYRQFPAWNLPPLVMQALGAHGLL